MATHTLLKILPGRITIDRLPDQEFSSMEAADRILGKLDLAGYRARDGQYHDLPTPNASSLPADATGTLLPAGFLSARGNQIVGPNGTPARIASVGLTGQNPNGCVGQDGEMRPEPAPFINQMRFRPAARAH